MKAYESLVARNDLHMGYYEPTNIRTAGAHGILRQLKGIRGKWHTLADTCTSSHIAQYSQTFSYQEPPSKVAIEPVIF